MNCSGANSMQTAADCSSPYELLLKAALLIPVSHYLIGFLFVLFIFLYGFLEIHIVEDLFTGFRGQPVSLTFNPGSQVYRDVASKCKLLQERYFATPWLSSPHLQTIFLSFFGRPPVFQYRRQLFQTSDGGTIALDWLTNSDVMDGVSKDNNVVQKDSTTPLMVVIPGLTSDSSSAYIKHLVSRMAKHGWNVVVSNHRGLGGISITSDILYNAGWTEDIRKVIDHLHCQYPEAPLFAVGTSIGANLLVKYLGEDGANTPIIGAVAICSPWDLLIGDRFISRRLVQRFYDKALTIGLKGYAQLHESILSRLADWEGIKRSRSVRDFDNYATCLVGKFETVDTYYRRCSSAAFVGGVAVPLLCISALDDPVCTKEAIPWDECRANKNIILATTCHGGHLAYFEGIAASSLWWVRAVEEFVSVLHSSPLIHKKTQMQISSLTGPVELSSIDQGPFLNVKEDGMVAAISCEPENNVKDRSDEDLIQNDNDKDGILDPRNSDHVVTDEIQSKSEIVQPVERDVNDVIAPIRKRIDQLSRNSKKSIWLLAYIAIVTTWPFLGSSLLMFLRRKFKFFFPAAPQMR